MLGHKAQQQETRLETGGSFVFLRPCPPELLSNRPDELTPCVLGVTFGTRKKVIEGVNMREFFQYTKQILAEDFRAQLTPFLAIYNFINHYAHGTSPQ